MSHRPASPLPAPCGRRFPEELLSGYLDRALTQGEEQRVRVHVEDCAACRTLLDELAALRETAMTTRFQIPPDDQWDDGEAPPYEELIEAAPDVILAPYSGITEEQYELLSEIAPTVAYPDGPWTTPWRWSSDCDATGGSSRSPTGFSTSCIPATCATWPRRAGRATRSSWVSTRTTRSAGSRRGLADR